MNLCLGGPTALCALRICRVRHAMPHYLTIVKPPSPAPYSRWSAAHLREALSPIEGLADAMGPARIDVCVPHRKNRVQSTSVRNIVCAPSWFKSPFMHVNNSLSFAGPELLLAQEAARGSLTSTALLAYELCGTYAHDPLAKTIRYGLDPVCDRASIRRFIQDTPGKIRGRSKLTQALAYVRENSWSPMESILALVLSLPLSKGGYGVRQLTLNRRAPDGQDCARIPDILLGSTKVGINYEGEGHFETVALTDAAIQAAACVSSESLAQIEMAGQSVRASIVRDKRRDRELMEYGMSVITMTKDDLNNITRLDREIYELHRLVCRSARKPPLSRDEFLGDASRTRLRTSVLGMIMARRNVH